MTEDLIAVVIISIIFISLALFCVCLDDERDDYIPFY
jgi:hypothetical protein